MDSPAFFTNHSNIAGSISSNHHLQPAPDTGHFEIRTLEWLNGNRTLQTSERLQWHEISWFRSGAGELIVDSAAHQIFSNRVYCLFPGQIRNYRIKAVAEGYRLCFSTDFLNMGSSNIRTAGWLDTYWGDNAVPVMEADEEMQYEMESLFRKMQHECSNRYLMRSEILSGLLNILMIYFSRKLQTTASRQCCSKDMEMVRRFKSLLKQHFKTKKLVSDYASELCVTPNYLNRTVKKVTGFTASHHIQQCIVMEAKRQAVHCNTSMKEIAYFLGFDNIAHFSKFFKNNSGMNFSSFKKKQILAD
jgi:AraC family transcriptional activator of pobA